MKTFDTITIYVDILVEEVFMFDELLNVVRKLNDPNYKIVIDHKTGAFKFLPVEETGVSKCVQPEVKSKTQSNDYASGVPMTTADIRLKLGLKEPVPEVVPLAEKNVSAQLTEIDRMVKGGTLLASDVDKLVLFGIPQEVVDLWKMKTKNVSSLIKDSTFDKVESISPESFDDVLQSIDDKARDIVDFDKIKVGKLTRLKRNVEVNDAATIAASAGEEELAKFLTEKHPKPVTRVVGSDKPVVNESIEILNDIEFQLKQDYINAYKKYLAFRKLNRAVDKESVFTDDIKHLESSLITVDDLQELFSK